MSDGHPVVAALLDTAMASLYHLRPELIAAARGEVLEIGVGTGQNLPLYRAPVAHVTGVEPDPHMLRRAQVRAAQATVPVTLHAVGAEALPFDDASFDTVVLTWVLCTIPDLRAATREIARVLRPDGEVLFIEHVRSGLAPIAAGQRLVEPVWKRLAGGCHLTRDAVTALRDAGLVVQARPRGGACSPAPLVQGVAHHPPSACSTR